MEHIHRILTEENMVSSRHLDMFRISVAIPKVCAYSFRCAISAIILYTQKWFSLPYPQGSCGTSVSRILTSNKVHRELTLEIEEKDKFSVVKKHYGKNYEKQNHHLL